MIFISILRISSINRAFSNAKVFVPFREPLQHAASLLNQHKRFCVQQSEDRFARKYMGWLGHFEFGVDHRPFYYGEDEISSNSGIGFDLELTEIDYWIQCWIDTYDHILGQYKAGQITCTFFSYDMLCKRPEEVTIWLNKFLGIEGEGSSGLSVMVSPKHDVVAQNKNLFEKAEEIYIELSRLSESNLY